MTGNTKPIYTVYTEKVCLKKHAHYFRFTLEYLKSSIKSRGGLIYFFVVLKGVLNREGAYWRGWAYYKHDAKNYKTVLMHFHGKICKTKTLLAAAGTPEPGGWGGGGCSPPPLFCSCMMSRLRHSIQIESISPLSVLKFTQL